MAEKHIYFVRHGQSEANASGVHRPEEEISLTEKGRAEAIEVAKRIAHIGVDALVTSTILRARQTSEAITECTKLQPEASDLFIETNVPTVFLGIHRDDPSSFEISKNVFESYANPSIAKHDGESFEHMLERAGQALAFLEQHPKDRICVVTHGRFLRALFVHMWAGKNSSGVEMQNALQTLITGNTGITYARFAPPVFNSTVGADLHPWRIVSWNDSAHLG